MARFNDRIEPTEKYKPWKTWKMILDGKNISGDATAIDALNQTIYTLLRIERYEWPVFKSNVGIKMSDLYGQSKRYVYAVLTQRIPETLLIDDRITSVENFKYDAVNSTGHRLVMSYTVRSKLGDFERKEVFNV